MKPSSVHKQTHMYRENAYRKNMYLENCPEHSHTGVQ